METRENVDKKVVDRANHILSDMGLSWESLKGKKVLDAGSGPSALAHAASLLGVDTQIFSTDINRNKKWKDLPGDIKNRIIQADTENLPFADESFDLVIDHASIGVYGIQEADRVLKAGGEFRMYPIGGQTLEYWYISYYLGEVKGQDPQTIQELIQKYDQEISEADGWVPNEYADLLEESLNGLTSDQKIGVIYRLVTRYEELTGIGPLDYKLKDVTAKEPNGVLIYQK